MNNTDQNLENIVNINENTQNIIEQLNQNLNMQQLLPNIVEQQNDDDEMPPGPPPLVRQNRVMVIENRVLNRFQPRALFNEFN